MNKLLFIFSIFCSLLYGSEQPINPDTDRHIPPEKISNEMAEAMGPLHHLHFHKVCIP